MANGQSTSLSWCQAPIWGPRRDFYYCHTVAGLLMWGILSDERTGLTFTIAAGPRRCSHIYHGQNQYYLSIFTILHAGILHSQSGFSWIPIIKILYITPVYMYVQCIHGLA
jgi:hypothetical protein